MKTLEQMIEEVADKPTNEEARNALARLAEGIHREARAEAQRLADADGYDRGIEANDYLKAWHVFMLPRKRNRFGHELRCEVVSAMDLSKCKPGHGP